MLTKLGVPTISVQTKIKCALGTIVKIILVDVRWRDIELFKTIFGLNIETSENIQSGLEHLKPVIIVRMVCLQSQVCSFLNIHHSRIVNVWRIAINQLFIQAQLSLCIGNIGSAKLHILKFLIFEGIIFGSMGDNRV